MIGDCLLFYITLYGGIWHSLGKLTLLEGVEKGIQLLTFADALQITSTGPPFVSWGLL